MKIKTKQRLNLPELIQHVWENDFSIKGFMVFKSDCDKFEVRISSHMLDYVWDKSSKFSSLPRGTTFTVEVKEEMTEETVFDELVFVYDVYTHRPSSGLMVRKSIQNVLEHKCPIYKIYALVDRSLVLIWTKEHGIPEHGVLELGAE